MAIDRAPFRRASHAGAWRVEHECARGGGAPLMGFALDSIAVDGQTTVNATLQLINIELPGQMFTAGFVASGGTVGAFDPDFDATIVMQLDPPGIPLIPGIGGCGLLTTSFTCTFAGIPFIGPNTAAGTFTFTATGTFGGSNFKALASTPTSPSPRPSRF